MSKKQCCLTCKTHWDRERLCEVCRWEDEDNPSVFYVITRSPELIAEEFVEPYTRWGEDGHLETLWRSNFRELSGVLFDTKEEAIAATLHELNQSSKKEDNK